ncbi:multifunctional 2',3'-cyclic-nucleotide 2'-phosphodiesterase/5'-nucleotidase/3'-nucleotidase [Neobacillus piezotolerans]|uniref:Multifunctional 2',3'-cyclic-nucleotide 2'-phosphodiesterase/5'-nucleotidase/3'-nucleotidase n=1 Tax=Neobacillus piezotolerans TaxID=2259171 RepID=A0A3D8GSW5_9BACI|nr:5'-nucleotidase C-terminal domain-containing protein [Neobacillus piezotolerans]RDU37564.1 multifunctional 2',3'-cyclic-nucleotide 2'-phosphodiesterase/5'-nucleotidase/3'-nucleotidase [Neobacillus piezotolerans]
MKNMKKGLIALVSAVVVGSGFGLNFASPVETAQAASKKITILHTNDSHGRVEESSADGMGFAKISTLVKQYEAQNPNTLLLDAGDTFHGTTFATLEKGESIAKVLNAVGYDGMAAGNHDFNYGYQTLLELTKKVNFPVLSANVRKKSDNSQILQPYEIKEVDGIKVGIFGLSTPETHYKTHPKNVEGLQFTDPVEEAKAMVAELKSKNVDVIVAVTHLGIDASSTDTSIKVAKGAPGIDLIVDGHSHSTLVEGLKEGNDTLIVSAGEYTKNLGVVELTFEGNKLVDKKAHLITKEQAKDVTPDPAILDVVKKVKDSQKEILSQVIGETGVVLDGERSQVRGGETNLGNLITDAMIDLTGADIAITNGGGIRASIPVGKITKGHVITVLPFGNYIVTKKLTGAQIKAGIENGVDSYPEPKGAFPHIGGMSFAIDVTREKGDRVHSLKVNGKPMEMDKEYLVATNDFMAAGGDEYTSFKDSPIVNEFPALDEALMNYIGKRGVLNRKVEGRIVAKTVEEVKKEEELLNRPVPVVYWDGTLMKRNQIGRISILHSVNLMKFDADGNAVVVRELKAGERYRVYSYNGTYGVGAGYFISDNGANTRYETPSKHKLALLRAN